MIRRLHIGLVIGGLLLACGCGPGLTPPSNSGAAAPTAGHSGSVDAGVPTKGGFGGASSLTAGTGGTAIQHDAGVNELDAGDEDAGEP